MPAPSAPWVARADGLALTVRLTPKSAGDRLEGVAHLADGRAVLKVRVRALPEAGAANDALIRLLAKTLSVPLSTISLASGATARLKVLMLKGDPLALEAKLKVALGLR